MYVSSPVVLTSAGDMLCAGHVTRGHVILAMA